MKIFMNHYSLFIKIKLFAITLFMAMHGVSGCWIYKAKTKVLSILFCIIHRIPRRRTHARTSSISTNR